jgi:hypothetical protein
MNPSSAVTLCRQSVTLSASSLSALHAQYQWSHPLTVRISLRSVYQAYLDARMFLEESEGSVSSKSSAPMAQLRNVTQGMDRQMYYM